MLARETITSTYLGNGVANPHGRSEDKDTVYQTGISVLTLGVKFGGKILITAHGPDEEDAVGELERLVQNGLGDEEHAPQGSQSDSPKQIEPNSVFPSHVVVVGQSGAEENGD